MKLYSMFVSQSGSIMFGFATMDVAQATQSAIRDGRAFMLKMKGTHGYSLIVVNPNHGGLTFRCNIAQDGQTCYETVPVDASGNPCSEESKAGDVAPSQASTLHIVFAPIGPIGGAVVQEGPPANGAGPKQPNPADVPDIADAKRGKRPTP